MKTVEVLQVAGATHVAGVGLVHVLVIGDGADGGTSAFTRGVHRLTQMAMHGSCRAVVTRRMYKPRIPVTVHNLFMYGFYISEL